MSTEQKFRERAKLRTYPAYRYKEIVGTATCRISVDVEGKTRGKWQSTGLVIQTGDGTNLGEKWRQDISQGADHVLRESWVTASDPHYERR